MKLSIKVALGDDPINVYSPDRCRYTLYRAAPAATVHVTVFCHSGSFSKTSKKASVTTPPLVYAVYPVLSIGSRPSDISSIVVVVGADRTRKRRPFSSVMPTMLSM